MTSCPAQEQVIFTYFPLITGPLNRGLTFVMGNFFNLFFFSETRASLYCSDCHETHYVVQAGLKLMALLPPSPKHGVFRRVSPCPALPSIAQDIFLSARSLRVNNHRIEVAPVFTHVPVPTVSLMLRASQLRFIFRLSVPGTPVV